MSDTGPYRVVIEERDRAPDNYAVKHGVTGYVVAGFNDQYDADTCCSAANAAYRAGAEGMKKAVDDYLSGVPEWKAIREAIRALPLPGDKPS